MEPALVEEMRRLRAWDLPVPAPVAARQVRGLIGHTADIVVAMIPQTRNVAQALSEGPLPAADWIALGRAIRQLHDRQVFHSDLNCHNILLASDGQFWLIDFDKCDIRPSGSWRQQNLDRLLRSLEKERRLHTGFCWQPEQWQALLLGYQQQFNR